MMALCAWHGAGTCEDTTCSRGEVQHAGSALEDAMTCGVGRTSFNVQAHCRGRDRGDVSRGGSGHANF